MDLTFVGAVACGRLCWRALVKMDGCAPRGREVHGDEYHEWAMITEFAPADSAPLWVMQRSSVRSSAALVHRGYGVC